jgi:hypothetical protein
MAARTPSATASTCPARPSCWKGSAAVWARPIASAGVGVAALEYDPMRRHGAFRAARHNEADPGGLFARQKTPEQEAKLQVRKAAAEIVDQAIAFGLAEHADHARGIDPSGGNRRLDP